MRTILVVDDEADLLEIVRSHLEDDGYHVLLARDGREALEIAKKARPHLILLDIAMPGMGGMEMLEDIKSMPGLEKIPVVMLTAQGQSSNILNAGELGASDFLIKPFTREELLKVVHKIL